MLTGRQDEWFFYGSVDLHWDFIHNFEVLIQYCEKDVFSIFTDGLLDWRGEEYFKPEYDDGYDL